MLALPAHVFKDHQPSTPIDLNATPADSDHRRSPEEIVPTCSPTIGDRPILSEAVKRGYLLKYRRRTDEVNISPNAKEAPRLAGAVRRTIMISMNPSIMTHRRLLLFKWLMIVIPPMTVAAGHLLQEARGPDHSITGTDTLFETLPFTFLALALAYLFVESLFRVLRRLQNEAVAREQDILIMNAVLQERERLSRELHDGAAQLVAHLLLRLDTIKELVATDQRQEAEAELERLHGIANEIYEDIGESITGLRTNVGELGLVGALQDYVEQFEERHQIPTSLRADAAAAEVSPLVALQLFRFVQEALTNVRKHAGAREAAVILTTNGPNQLSVVITDDGRGFIPDAPTVGSGKARPLGLTSMRERVEALGGAFEVQSQPGAGTRVTATIPILPLQSRMENGHGAVAAPPR